MDRLQHLKAAILGTPFPRSQTLTISSNNLKQIQIKLRQDKDCYTLEAKDLQKLITQTGPLRIYDPGYKYIICTRTNISFIDGVRGILQFRGYPIHQLASKSTYLQTTFLLIFGQLPSKDQLSIFQLNVKKYSIIPKDLTNLLKKFRRDADPMSIFISLLNALPIIYNSQKQKIQNVYTILALMPTIVASVYCHSIAKPLPIPSTTNFVQNFLNMLGLENITPKIIRAFQVLLIVHAQHGASCSTSLVCHLASAGTNLFTSIAAGAGALSGSKHGGASSAVLRMLQNIGSKQNIPRFLMQVRNKKKLLYGFGNRVYRSSDPRSKVVRKMFTQIFQMGNKDPLIQLALELERIALADHYLKLYPNMDFYTSLIFRAIGLSKTVMPLFYAISRTAGWLAHWLQFVQDQQNKLVRPRQSYTGFGRRLYIQQNQRVQHYPNIEIQNDPLNKRRELSHKFLIQNRQ